MEVGSSAAAEAPPQQQQQAQPPAGQAQAGALPCKTAAFEANVGGSPCQFSITAYSDRLMVIASQLGTLGSVSGAGGERGAGRCGGGLRG